ncbi:MAG: hypothetical protein LBM13_06020 [Candidatus Ancillula sp.]|jgi:hypothetical protein|nr:hypothetical protein [Candidatus Ancillula sp.]
MKSQNLVKVYSVALILMLLGILAICQNLIGNDHKRALASNVSGDYDNYGVFTPSLGVNLRTMRFVGDKAYYLKQKPTNKLGVVDLSKIDGGIGALSSTEVSSGGEYPYDIRTYSPDGTKQFICVGNRDSNNIAFFDITPKSKTYMNMVAKINVNGSPVKMAIDDSKGLLYAPLSSSNQMVIVDLTFLGTKYIANGPKFLSYYNAGQGAGPERIVTIKNTKDVVLCLNRASSQVDAVDVSNPKNPVRVGRVNVGKSPYYGEGDNQTWFVGNTEDDTVSAIDISDPFNIKFICNIKVGNMAYIPIVTKNPLTGKRMLSVTNEGYNGVHDGIKYNHEAGAVSFFDISDMNNVTRIGRVALPWASAGNELLNNDEEQILLTSNTDAEDITNGGSWSEVDFSDPTKPILKATYYTPGDEPHYVKRYTNKVSGKRYVIATGRVKGQLWFWKDRRF